MEDRGLVDRPVDMGGREGFEALNWVETLT